MCSVRPIHGLRRCVPKWFSYSEVDACQTTVVVSIDRFQEIGTLDRTDWERMNHISGYHRSTQLNSQDEPGSDSYMVRIRP